MRDLRKFDVKNKRVLVRCDFNVPLSDKGEILDDFRIKESIRTIEYLIKKEAKVILMSHLGRPEGRVVKELRLTPVQNRLMEYLDLSVVKAPDCVGSEIEKWTYEMQPGEILLLENLRLHKEEEKGDLNFAKELARLGDIYINDAFGASHRPHASITGVPKFLPSAAGFLLQKEVDVLSGILAHPKRPLVAIVGGVKIESKIMVIKTFLEKADHLLLGGEIANSVLAVKGIWLFGERPSKEAVEEIKKVPLTSTKLHLPVDVLASSDSSGKAYVRQSALAEVKKDELLLDIGSETIDIFSRIIKEARTIVWSGPLGFFENPLFEKGTKEIAQAIIRNHRAFKVVGGGETMEFINKIGLTEKFNHVSTGGGAMLEFLSGKKLPGVEALK
ncbi:MAG: phosphoglycerate kinase [Candidatus Nealsonbacteria bacterium CG02_land_8_20_14_3_00_37_10]|uniref:Phosphoglycerate kinase n=1 Tax=Candidatus Nealsonbacteria bacterium CG02_land_8_20_14_3_00_37_10 TaxID=1974699 RepID=A0A2M7D8Z1_9BACT|nr:MAG: phosphoglycerate kinase [Candidatus Nealsonbacteria bacterium CG02_land_8_20_14_3_00_37_10]